MHFLEILSPGLVATLAAATADPAADRLRRVLARADRSPAQWCGEELEIPALLGMTAAGDRVPALAAITAAYDFGRRDLASNLCRADPVHLRADPSRLILFDAESIALDATEADALIAYLNERFDGQDVRFERGCSPARWYAVAAGLTATHTPSPRALRGLPVESCLADMRATGGVGRLMTEVQMVLHEAPVNLAREAAGKPAVNSVWFWGLGPRPHCTSPRLAALVSDDELAAACALACDVPCFPLAGGIERAAAAAAGPVGVVASPNVAASPAVFERELMVPALRVLGERRVDRLRVHSGEVTLELTRMSRWKLWRRPARVPRTRGEEGAT